MSVIECVKYQISVFKIPANLVSLVSFGVYNYNINRHRLVTGMRVRQLQHHILCRALRSILLVDLNSCRMLLNCPQ